MNSHKNCMGNDGGIEGRAQSSESEISLPHKSCGIWRALPNFVHLRFYICKMGVIIAVSHRDTGQCRDTVSKAQAPPGVITQERLAVRMITVK